MCQPYIECATALSDIFVGMYVYRMPICVGRITWPKHAHAHSQFGAVQTDL